MGAARQFHGKIFDVGHKATNYLLYVIRKKQKRTDYKTIASSRIINEESKKEKQNRMFFVRVLVE